MFRFFVCLYVVFGYFVCVCVGGGGGSLFLLVIGLYGFIHLFLFNN